VFTLIKAELDQSEDELSEKQIETAEQLATYWSSHLAGIRDKLYQTAVENTTKETEVRFWDYREGWQLIFILCSKDPSRNRE
jgi:hypothetical protein